mgnify:CR=1 FL=1
MAPSSLAPTTQTLEVPGARLYYEVRGTGPLVVLVGAPMDAGAFGPLADLLAGDYTVLTTDPRGINRSPVDDPDQDGIVQAQDPPGGTQSPPGTLVTISVGRFSGTTTGP